MFFIKLLAIDIELLNKKKRKSNHYVVFKLSGWV